jgi:hypothetical protein
VKQIGQTDIILSGIFFSARGYINRVSLLTQSGGNASMHIFNILSALPLPSSNAE